MLNLMMDCYSFINNKSICIHIWIDTKNHRTKYHSIYNSIIIWSPIYPNMVAVWLVYIGLASNVLQIAATRTIEKRSIYLWSMAFIILTKPYLIKNDHFSKNIFLFFRAYLFYLFFFLNEIIEFSLMQYL